MSEILRMQKISKSFPGVQALKNVNFTLESGHIHALVGENGAGKSTLVKIISGVYEADSGDIFLEGKKIKFKDANDAVSAGISTVHQDLIVFPDLSVLENLFIDNYSVPSTGFIKWKNLKKIAVEAMEEFSISLPLEQEARNLSAPMRKLLQILRALLKKPKILILDEPTAALTMDEAKMLFTNLRRLKNKGIGIIYISHLLEEIFQLADEVTVLRNGEEIITDEVSNLKLSDIVKAMIGRELQSYYPRRKSKIGQTVVSVTNLSSGILKNIDIEVKKGEILGIAGILGSGRTTLAKTLFGITPLQKGEIFLNGNRLNIKSPVDAINAGIVYIPEDRQRQGLILQENVRFNISLPNLKLTMTKHGFIDKIKEESIAEKAIHDFGIEPPFPDFQCLHLSGGNQQKTVLSKWTLRNADVIIMDEPTQGIDVGTKNHIYIFMNEFASRGKAIIFISSDFNELINMCDRIIVLRKGVIVGELSKTDFSLEKVVALSTIEDVRVPNNKVSNIGSREYLERAKLK